MSHPLSLQLPRVSGSVNHQALGRLLKEHVELFLLCAVVLVYALHTYLAKGMMQTVLDAPQKNDFFYVDYRALKPDSNPRFRYVPLKVLQVDERGIKFKAGNIGHTTPVSPSQHAKFDKAVALHNYYRQGHIQLSHEQVNQLVESGAIYEARRPRNVYIGGWIVLEQHELVAAP